MNDITPESLIAYDEIVQEALRAVVSRVLEQVVADGGVLPGNHHFYITFRTGKNGVKLPSHLRDRFPEEMTIVLQNKFWDLEVHDSHFSVGLTFNQIPTNLVIPYAAITAFVDPAVDFGLQFQASDGDLGDETQDVADGSGERQDAVPIVQTEDGSNVVSVDFGKRK